MRHTIAAAALVAVFTTVVPAAVFAQGSIGGVVRDTSGGALPGVVVEAVSPALIERVRTVASDGNGQYLIVDLRPGTYSVTFTLAGFSVLKREGLVVSSGVTLPVNAELAVSAVQETVTVTGESPVVDVQNTSRQSIMGHELLDAIPRSQSLMQIVAALPAVSTTFRDVGGSEGDWAAGGQVVAHGSLGNDQASALDGMRFHHFIIGGSISLMPLAQGAVQEYAFNVSAGAAEIPTGGVFMNAIPRDGGNTFRGNVYASYTGSGMTTTEMPEELRTRWGLTKREQIQRIHAFNPTLGGPIARDRLWFYASGRSFGTNKYPLDTFHESDPTRPMLWEEPMWTASLRLTWQASQRNKVTFYGQKSDRTSKNVITNASLFTAESAGNQDFPGTLLQSRWTSPVTSRLLLEAGVLHTWGEETYIHSDFAIPNGYPTLELTTGKLFHRRPNSRWSPTATTNVAAAMSYVTGTHAVKVGFQHLAGFQESIYPDEQPQLEFSNGVPVSVRYTATPRYSRIDLQHDLGVYVQDNWKVAPRVTLDVGLRFDWLNQRVPVQEMGASVLNPVGARRFEEVRNVPNWKDLNPRVGGVWDVFGNGRTAVKASATRFINMDVTTFVTSVNPAAASSNDRRTWADNGDRIPQANEVGPSTNLTFGRPVLNVRPDPSLSEGWGKRNYNWEYTVSVQHELRPGLGLTVGYYRRAFGNLTWTNNRAITPADFTPFTIANPLGGDRITLYNLNPAKRGLTDNVVELAPDDSRVFDGVDIVVNGRFGAGGVVNGGLTMGRTATDSCTVSDPNQLRFCKVTPGFFEENQYKFLVAYPLAYGLEVSSSFRSLRGIENTGPGRGNVPWIVGNYTVTSAIAGIPLTNATISVPVVEPATLFPERTNMIDARLGKSVRVRGVRLLGYVEGFNILNSAGIRAVNTTVGPLWQRPVAVTAGRMMRIGGQIDF